MVWHTISILYGFGTLYFVSVPRAKMVGNAWHTRCSRLTQLTCLWLKKGGWPSFVPGTFWRTIDVKCPSKFVQDGIWKVKKGFVPVTLSQEVRTARVTLSQEVRTALYCPFDAPGRFVSYITKNRTCYVGAVFVSSLPYMADVSISVMGWWYLGRVLSGCWCIRCNVYLVNESKRQ